MAGTFFFVMLIWGGAPVGGPTTIQGFRSIEACERAIPEVLRVMEKDLKAPSVAKCISLSGN